MQISDLDYLEFLTEETSAQGGFVATYTNTTARSGFGAAEAGAVAIGDATATAAFTSTNVLTNPFVSTTRSRASASAISQRNGRTSAEQSQSLSTFSSASSLGTQTSSVSYRSTFSY